MAAVRSLASDSQLAAGEGNVVENHDYFLGRNLIELRNVSDCRAAVVHECLRLNEQASVAVDNNICDKRIVFEIRYLRVKLACNMVQRQEACIVSCEFVVFAGIAEADDEKLNRAGCNSLASFKEHFAPQEIVVLKR